MNSNPEQAKARRMVIAPMYLANPNRGLRDLTEDIESTIGDLQGIKWREREDTTSLEMEIYSPYLYKPSRN